MLEGEGVRRRAVILQITQALFRFVDGGFVAGGDPPADEVRLLVQIEELEATAIHGGVAGLVSVVEEGVGGLPDAEVDDDQRVVVDADGGGVALFGLEPPDEAGGVFGETIEGVESGHEGLDARVVERGDEAGDVVLRKVVFHGALIVSEVAGHAGSARGWVIRAFGPKTADAGYDKGNHCWAVPNQTRDRG